MRSKKLPNNEHNVDTADGGAARNGTGRPVRGAQLVSFTARVLRALAESTRGGARIVDLVERTGLPRATINRVVRGLCAEGLATRDGDGRYRLGGLAFELGLAAEQQFPLREIAAASMARISTETGDTCFLMMRSGADAVCIARHEGGYPVRALTIDVGNRRPLGAAAASLALLMHMPEKDCDAYIDRNAARIARYGMLNADVVRGMVENARRLGFALNHDNILPEVSAVGVAIPARAGQPYAALSVAALTSRIMKDNRYRAIAALLQREALQISELSISG
ncbi:MAG TPA: IclR family transcriptional regulator [Bordetella sp.]|nr:IclR family transcriptional regulator [Bordetella sp.]